MAMVNTSMMPTAAAVINPNVKDSRWLTLETCREFTRNKCTRSDTECKFAHPPPHVEVQNGRVTCCFDSIKGKCQRKDPPCKYLHPPQHLKEQLLQNGRNNLLLRNLTLSAYAAGGLQPLAPGMMPVVYESNAPVASKPAVYQNTVLQAQQYPGTIMTPIMITNPASQAQSFPYLSPAMTGLIPGTLDPTGLPSAGASSQMAGMVHGTSPAINPAQKISRVGDRLEVCREYQRGSCSRSSSECRYAHPPDNVAMDSIGVGEQTVTVCMDFMKGKCSRDTCRYFHPPPHLQSQLRACQRAGSSLPPNSGSSLPNMQGVVPMMKRTAMADSKSGVPVYHPVVSSATSSAAAYQQAALAAMQLQQQPFVPVTLAGHPPGVPRF